LKIGLPGEVLNRFPDYLIGHCVGGIGRHLFVVGAYG
jgi:hypothetical protein